MSGTNERYQNSLLAMFSFDEMWDGRTFCDACADFAEKRAQQLSEDADLNDTIGYHERAESERKVALWWRDLERLPHDEGKAIESDAELHARESVDTLLARGKVSDEPFHALAWLSIQIQKGLAALAANGNKKAASMLLFSLSMTIEDFEKLALLKPDVFVELTRNQSSVPALISQHTERKAANVHLAKVLRVAENHHLKLPIKPTKGRPFVVYDTPTNFWASRLVEYIVLARIVLPIRPLEPASTPPEVMVWTNEALALSELSPFNWRQWASVAWKVVLDVTQGKPEEEKHLLPLGKAAGRKKTIKGNQHGSLSQAANIRAEISRKLTTGIKRLACGPKCANE